MKRLLLMWAISTVALMALPAVFSTISIESWPTAIVSAAVIGIINVSIGPVVKLLALPITIVTLGFFHLVINAVLLLVASELVPGFDIDGFWTAFFASILYSVICWALSSVLVRD